MSKRKKTTRTPRKKTAADVFDFAQGETREATVKGVAIKFKVPEGPAIVGLHLSASRVVVDATAAAEKYAEFVVDHLIEWPWGEVEIDSKSMSAMMRKDSELFWAIQETIEKAGEVAKN